MIYLDPMGQLSFWIMRYAAEYIVIPLLVRDPFLFCVGVAGIVTSGLVWKCVK